jgi:hypothetical protein
VSDATADLSVSGAAAGSSNQILEDTEGRQRLRPAVVCRKALRALAPPDLALMNLPMGVVFGECRFLSHIFLLAILSFRMKLFSALGFAFRISVAF